MQLAVVLRPSSVEGRIALGSRTNRLLWRLVSGHESHQDRRQQAFISSLISDQWWNTEIGPGRPFKVLIAGSLPPSGSYMKGS